MTDPVPEFATRLTLGDDGPRGGTSPTSGPAEAGCRPGPGPASPVPAPVPVPGPGSQAVSALPEMGLGSRKLTWLEWLWKLVAHWTGLYAGEMKRRRQKNPPPPERLAEHIRWVLASGWDAWLPDSCEWLRRYVLGPVEGTYQVLVGIPAHLAGASLKNIFRRSVTGIPALVLIIDVLIRVHAL